MNTLRWFRAATFATAVVTAGILVSPFAIAHGYQESATPAPNSRFLDAPDQVVIRMTEPVELGETTVRVLSADGADVTNGPLASEDGGAQTSVLVQPVAVPGEGTYTVTWKTLWVSDGHITDGAFAFAIGNATLPAQVDAGHGAAAWPGAAESAFRALGFGAWIVAAGALAYPRLVSEAGWRHHDAASIVRPLVRRRTASIALAAGVVALGAAAGSLLDQSYRTGYGSDVVALGRATSIGQVLLARVGLALALVVAALLARSRRVAHAGAAALAVGGLATLTLSSHARAVQVRVPYATLPDFVHLVAAAAWVGTLVSLLLCVPILMRHTSKDDRGVVAGPLIARVSLVATLSVALLVLTGTFAAIVHLGSLSALVSTLYGRVLLAKLGLVLGLMALGFVNRQFFTPAFQRAGAHLPDGKWGFMSFRRVVGVEVTLMALVIVTTGALAGISPQENAVVAPSSATFNAEGAEFTGTLILAPAVLGVNEATVDLTDEAGERLTDVTRVTLVLVPLDADVPPAETVLESTSEPGVFRGNVTFGLAGEWLVTAKVQRSTAYDDSADFFVTIPR